MPPKLNLASGSRMHSSHMALKLWQNFCQQQMWWWWRGWMVRRRMAKLSWFIPGHCTTTVSSREAKLEHRNRKKKHCIIIHTIAHLQIVHSNITFLQGYYFSIHKLTHKHTRTHIHSYTYTHIDIIFIILSLILIAKILMEECLKEVIELLKIGFC